MTTTTATTTAASVYQQLRGHLTDLKLADAADALPAVLVDDDDSRARRRGRGGARAPRDHPVRRGAATLWPG